MELIFSAELCSTSRRQRVENTRNEVFILKMSFIKLDVMSLINFYRYYFTKKFSRNSYLYHSTATFNKDTDTIFKSEYLSDRIRQR